MDAQLAADREGATNVQAPAAQDGDATAEGSGSGQEALRTLRRFTQAASRGDLDGVLAVSARDITFDSVGRVFRGHDGLREFIGGEVIALGGRYRELSARLEGDRAIVEYDFRTSSGGREQFTYDCTTRRSLLVDCIGRYVN